MYFGPGPIEVVMLLMLGGGGGLPLGVPPAPEDPLLAKVAPDECIFYLSWSGMADADPNSTNQTEQLAAEPEVRQLVTELKRQILASLLNEAQRNEPGTVPLIQDAAGWVETLLTHPAAIFISDMQVTPNGPPNIRGGALVRVGDDAAKLKAQLEKYQAAMLGGAAQPVDVGGSTWYRLKLDPDAPEITWGVRGKYIIVGIGEGSVEGIWERAQTPAPKWLTTLRARIPVDRVSTVSYINVKGIFDALDPVIDEPEFTAFMGASGLGDVTSVGSVAGLDEKGFINRTLIAVDGEPSGLLAFAAGKPLTAADLAAIPRDADVAAVARINAEGVFDTIATIVGAVEPRGRQEMDREIAAIEQMFQFKLRNVLQAVGDTVTVYNSPGEGGLVFTGLTAVVPVKDHATLSSLHEKLVEIAEAELKQEEARYRENADDWGYRPVVPTIRRIEFAGETIYFLDPRDDDVPLAPAWCLTEKELIGALFPQSIKAYLSRAEGGESLAAAPDVAAVLADGNGPVAMTYIDVPRLFDLVYPLVPMFAQMLFSEAQSEGFDLDVSILPSAKAIRPHLRPEMMVVRRHEAGIELVGHQNLPMSGVGVATPMMILPWLLFASGRAVYHEEMMMDVGPEVEYRSVPLPSARSIPALPHRPPTARKTVPPSAVPLPPSTIVP